MRRIAILLASIAILANLAYFIEPPSKEGTTDNNDDPDITDGDGDLIISDITTLTVPPMKIGDQALYDYSLFAQMFWENKTSGEWGRYTFTGEGELLNYVEDIVETEDGFQITHDTLEVSYETRASFQVKIEGSDVDTATIPGNLDVQRSKFTNIFDEHAIKTISSGTLAVENLGTVIGGGGGLPVDVSYDADLKTYPDPMEDPVLTLDDAIYAKQQQLRLKSNGIYEGEPLWEDLNREYNWSVEGAYKLLDHDTFKVNVTSDIWGFLYFNRQFYITADYPFPIKGYTRTNSSYESPEESFYIILETEQQIKDQEGSLRRGTESINWGDTSGHNEYVDLHPAGEFEKWDYAPDDGTELDRSSFNSFSLNQAVDFAIENSDGLDEFLDEYERKGLVMIEDSVWNTSTEDRRGKNTTTWWNLSFAYVYETDEIWQYREDNDDWPEWRYRLLVARSVEETLTGGTKVSTFISRDDDDKYHGPRKTYPDDGVNKDNLMLNTEICTLTHAEKILRIDNDVKDTVFKNNKLIEGVKFYYGITGFNEGNNQGLLLIQELTGIVTPTADNAFGLQSDSIWSSGSTFSAAIDANTGQMLYVTTVEGSELASLFSGGN